MQHSGNEIVTVLVTGADGFIGRSVVEALTEAGMTITAHLGPPDTHSGSLPNGVRGVCALIENLEAVRELLQGVDAIVHLAGPPSVAESFKKPSLFSKAHVVGTANIVEACWSHQIRRLVYVSSAEVYGRPDRNPVGEDARCNPCSPYAGMKVAAEAIVRASAENGGPECVVLRPFSVIGPGLAPYSVLREIIEQSLSNREVAVHSPHIIRDYVFVDDVAEAIRRSLVCKLSKRYQIYNIGSGRGVSIYELAVEVQSLLRLEKPVRTSNEIDRPRNSDIDALVADIRLAKKELAWQPEVGMQEGLRRTIESRRHS